MVPKELHHLLARPALVVHAGILDQAARPKLLARQPLEVAIRILVEADFLSQSFGIQRPPLDVRGVGGMLPEGWKIGHLLLDGQLHVMPGDAFVVRDRLDLGKLTMLEVPGVYIHLSRAGAIGRPLKVTRPGGFLLPKRLHGYDLELGLW